MSMPIASILIFDIKKRFLMYKILNKELTDDLLDKFRKTYETDAENTDTTSNVVINCDFIYGYFAPLINSFDITKDLNYSVDYILFNNNQYIIRFNLYDNLLILCFYNPTILSITFKLNSSANRMLFQEYYTNWCCKSMISLIKYKFGVCSDERCFNSANDELKKLFYKWSYYHLSDEIFFMETIDYLQINDETKSKCEALVKGLFQLLIENEQISSEFDYLEEYNSDDDIDSINNGKIMFTYDDDSNIESSAHKKANRITKDRQTDDIEEFFDDSNFMEYCVLSCGTKVVYKCESKSLFSNNKSDAMLSNGSQALDSSSLFMILLEAATFLNHTFSNPFIDDDTFKSPTSSPSAVSIIDDYQLSVKPRGSMELSSSSFNIPNANYESFKSVRSTPLINATMQFRTPIDDNKSPVLPAQQGKYSELDEEIRKQANETPNHPQNDDNDDDYKISYCFLKNSNKSYNFYDVLFVKLNSNLCLTLLKLNSQSKYAELISDLDGHLNELLLILDHKSLLIANAEADLKACRASGDLSTATTTPPDVVHQKDEENEGKFLSIFINKLITFYEKLQLLKNELNARLILNDKIKLENTGNSRKNSADMTPTTLKYRQKGSNEPMGSQFLTTKVKAKMSKSDSSFFDRKSSLSHERRHLSMTQVDIIRNQLKLINTIQVKINQLVGNKQLMNCFNTNKGFLQRPQEVDNDGLLKIYGQCLIIYRNVKVQVDLIKSNLKDLLFELFLRSRTGHKLSSSRATKSERFLRYTLDNTMRRSDSKKSSGNMATMLSQQQQFNSLNFMKLMRMLMKTTNFSLYMAYIDVKLKCNVAMSYYNLPGLVHFCFINRNENIVLIPTIDLLPNLNLNEVNVHVAYRKYYPLATMLLFKHDCTRAQFVDNDLGVVFNYSIWFEDKNSNTIPVDFSQSRRNQFNYEQPQAQQSDYYMNAYFNGDKKATCPPGITFKSYYDLLRKFCYPNAAESIVCYELITLHSIKLSEQKIKEQFFGLASILSQLKKKQRGT